MSDLEQRVSMLERDMSALKDRVGAMDADLKAIPDLIKTEHRFTNSQIARLSSEVARLTSDVTVLRDLPAKVDAMPRVIAELVSEMLGDHRKKS